MSDYKKLIENLTTLNQIIETLNETVDVQQGLDFALTRLIEMMNLETGWIFLKDPAAQNRWAGKGYTLVAFHNLPQALALSRARAWKGTCECQRLCQKGLLTAAYNEVHCSRLLHAPGERARLKVHASAPLRAGDDILGILNVAAPDWDSFSPEALVLLSNVGSQIGIALERARLYEMLQDQHIHEQAALLALSSQLLARSDLDDLMHYLVEQGQELLQADACAVLLPGEDPGYLAFQAASGWRDDPVEANRRVPADTRSGSGLVMHTHEPLLIEDIFSHDPTPWTTEWLKVEDFRAHAVVPLLVEGRAIGTLMLDTRQPRSRRALETNQHLHAARVALSLGGWLVTICDTP